MKNRDVARRHSAFHAIKETSLVPFGFHKGWSADWWVVITRPGDIGRDVPAFRGECSIVPFSRLAYATSFPTRSPSRVAVSWNDSPPGGGPTTTRRSRRAVAQR